MIADDFGQLGFNLGVLLPDLGIGFGLGQVASRLIFGLIIILRDGPAVFSGQLGQTTVQEGTSGTLSAFVVKDPGGILVVAVRAVSFLFVRAHQAQHIRVVGRMHQ